MIMKKIHIWGRLNSINAQKVFWLCEDLHIEFDRTNAGLEFGVNKTPTYLEMNPNGLVPVINDNGFILWESHSILRYLAKNYGAGNSYYPSSSAESAKVDQWLDWANTMAWPAMRPLFFGWIRTKPENRNALELENARVPMTAIFRILNEQLKKSTWVAGETFTLADITLALIAYRWFNLPIEREEFEHLDVWFKNATQKPGFLKYGNSPLT